MAIKAQLEDDRELHGTVDAAQHVQIEFWHLELDSKDLKFWHNGLGRQVDRFWS
jgi:hypothetical protein